MENDNFLVTIIVRTKDRPKLLRRALQSIAAQTYRPIEVVLVNDGGCDLDLEDIKDILGSTALNYVRLAENRGRAHAGNVGFQNATGEYIGFLDDDDEFYPEHVATLVAFLDQSNYEVAYTDSEMVFQEFSPDAGKIVDISKTVFSRDFDYSELIIGNYIPFNSVLFSRRAQQIAGAFDEDFEFYEDWDLLIRIGDKYPFYHIKKISTRYNQWSKELQINRTAEERRKMMSLQVIGKHRERISPELILAMRYERERIGSELEGLRKRAGALEMSLSENYDSMVKLEAAVKEENDHISHLEESLRERDSRIAQLEESLRERDSRIAQLEESLRERDTRLLQLEGSINLMRDTLGWKVLERFRSIREIILSPGTLRREIYDLIVKRRGVTNRDDRLGSHDHRTKWEHGSAIQAQLQLARKAYSVLRTQGLRTFFRYCYAYLIHGRHAFGPVPLEPKDLYGQWIARNENGDEPAIRREIEEFADKPKISIITPVYNVDPKWLDRCVESVKRQLYENWELCLHDDASTDKGTVACLKRWKDRDERIKVSFGEKNRGISAASNQALEAATGEFVALLDNDDELSPHALYEVVKLLNTYDDADVIYSDEDRITETEDGTTRRFDPFFKPDWSPQLLFACMYTGHLSVYRKSLMAEVGGFRSEYDFSQDYDLALRATEKTGRIRHIPKVLYHWRAIPSSAAAGGKDYARASNIEALKAAVERRGYDAEVLAYPCANRVRFYMRNNPLVSIIIPTDNKRNALNSIERILRNTTYSPFEIIAVTTSELGADILGHFGGDPRITVASFDRPFNFSLKCNEGAAAARGEYLLFFNDDVEAVENPWLEDMMSVFGKGNVGGVSPKLFYEDDTIQYAGMVTGVRGLIGTAFHCQPKDSCSYFNFIQSERDVSLLTGACLLIPRDVFKSVGGFDAVNTPIMHSDIDLCFRLKENGYELIYTPFASLRHIGHLSLKETDKKSKPEKNKAETYVLKKWGDFLSNDPFYTANMKDLLYRGGTLNYRLRAGRQEGASSGGKDILCVTHDLSLSGAPILMFYLACHFKKQGYFVTVMSPYDGELSEKYEKENIPVMIDATLSDNPFRETKTFMANFDLIVANTILMWPSVFVAREYDIPVIWITHESLAGRQVIDRNKRAAEALRIADEVIFACHATASLYKDYGNGNNFRIINYGTRPLESESAKVRRNTTFSILHVGSIEPRKGQDVLVKSALDLPKKYGENIEVSLVGRQLDNEFYGKIVKMLKPMRNVKLIGQIPHEQVAEFMAEADLFVCSSRDEVFPLTILEAMSLGKAIISTDVGGVSEMIRNNEDGIIVPNEDSKALAEKIAYLYDHREELERLGENASKRFYDKYTVDKFGDRILDIAKERLNAS